MTACRFCLQNCLLIDEPVLTTTHFYVLGSIESARPAQAIIIPLRHIETPFALSAPEWADLGPTLDWTREWLSSFNPQGFTIGWNVGAVAGQEIFHAHLHVIGRFADDGAAGRGIHALFRNPD